MSDFIVTPWEVSGEVDYKKLVEQFGIKLIDSNILERLEKFTRNIHPYLKRRIFFAHRDFDWILEKFQEGTEFFL